MRSRVTVSALFPGVVLALLTLVAAASFVAVSDLRTDRIQYEVLQPHAAPMPTDDYRIGAALKMHNELMRREAHCQREQRTLKGLLARPR